MDSLLVIHIGAGRHALQHSKEYTRLLKKALRSGDIIDASRVIEASALTNTGYGSSVDRTGEATSDASILEVDKCRIVSSLALLNIYDDAYPTACVYKVSQDLEKVYSAGSTNRSFGLSRPSSLDYKIYSDFVGRNSGFFSDDMGKHEHVAGHKRTSLISGKNSAAYNKFKAIFEKSKTRVTENQTKQEKLECSESFKAQSPAKRRKTESLIDGSDLSPKMPENLSSNSVEDTVGYIQISTSGNTSLATSSGGNFYRIPGRVSCAGIIGTGIGYSVYEDIEVSCMCSGNGDDIITMNLAAYLSESFAQTLANSHEWPELGPLLESSILRKGQQVLKTAVDEHLQEITYVGVVLIVRTPKSTRLVFCHSTESFYFGFVSQGKMEIVLSRNTGSLGRFLHGEYKLQ